MIVYREVKIPINFYVTRAPFEAYPK